MSDIAMKLRMSSPLDEPRKLCDALGLGKTKSVVKRNYVMVCCPWHGEKNPSCSVRMAGDGTVSVHCFSCGHNADAIGLIAVIGGWSLEGPDYSKVIHEACELAGRHDLWNEFIGSKPMRGWLREAMLDVPRTPPSTAKQPPAAEGYPERDLDPAASERMALEDLANETRALQSGQGDPLDHADLKATTAMLSLERVMARQWDVLGAAHRAGAGECRLREIETAITKTQDAFIELARIVAQVRDRKARER